MALRYALVPLFDGSPIVCALRSACPQKILRDLSSYDVIKHSSAEWAFAAAATAGFFFSILHLV